MSAYRSAEPGSSRNENPRPVSTGGPTCVDCRRSARHRSPVRCSAQSQAPQGSLIELVQEIQVALLNVLGLALATVVAGPALATPFLQGTVARLLAVVKLCARSGWPPTCGGCTRTGTTFGMKVLRNNVGLTDLQTKRSTRGRYINDGSVWKTLLIRMRKWSWGQCRRPFQLGAR